MCRKVVKMSRVELSSFGEGGDVREGAPCVSSLRRKASVTFRRNDSVARYHWLCVYNAYIMLLRVDVVVESAMRAHTI